MRKITMEYPLSGNNQNLLFDGESHTIRPIDLGMFVIGDREFYIMTYFDLNCECECVTLLTVINGRFVKVPLNNYDLLRQLLSDLPIEQVSEEILPDEIALAQTIQIESLIEAKTKPTPEFNFNRYIPYNANFNPVNIDNRIFASSGLVYEDGNQEYEFDKVPDCKSITEIIKKRMLQYKDKLDDKKTFAFNIKVNVPAGTTAFAPTKDGRLKMALLIPGIHNYRILVTPCINELKNNEVLDCYSCSISAPATKYMGLHDTDRAFRDGYLDLLDMTFDGIPFSKEKLR